MSSEIGGSQPAPAPPSSGGDATTAAGPRVLLVDDDATFRRAMAKALGRKGFAVHELAGGAAAISALSDETCGFDVVVLDLLMPDVSGMQVLRRTPRRRAPVVVLTGHGTVPDAVEAMRLGAFSFLQKPLDADELLPVLRQALQTGRAARTQLVGESPIMRSLRQVLDNCAQAVDPVLLYGETGTGKEVAATYLHMRSRRSGPLVAINLSCLPRELVESELFGHARGAFTGADRKKRGLCTEAAQGTLFLDEVSELPLDLQPKLLRVLETRSFRPVGETREEALQARLICATNRDLRQLVRKGLFREDLYYRLAVLPVELPPLRRHPEDIVPIAEHWLKKLAEQAAPGHGAPRTGKGGGAEVESAPVAAPVPLKLSEAAKAALIDHDYPGNVRELVNVVRRLALFAEDGTINAELVRRMLAEDPFRTLREETPEARSKSSPNLASATPDLIASQPANAEPLSLREVEIRHIERLLREHKNITTVAKLLDIDRRTLQRKLRTLGIDWRDE
jgi:DNA-binding NtrC family response regulator